MRNEKKNISLADIAIQKAAIEKQLGKQKEKVNELTQNFMAPFKPVAKKSNAVMGAFNTSLAIFDGVLIGYKLLRRVKKFWR